MCRSSKLATTQILSPSLGLPDIHNMTSARNEYFATVNSRWRDIAYTDIRDIGIGFYNTNYFLILFCSFAIFTISLISFIKFHFDIVLSNVMFCIDITNKQHHIL